LSYYKTGLNADYSKVSQLDNVLFFKSLTRRAIDKNQLKIINKFKKKLDKR